jgi:hypothetical protein
LSVRILVRLANRESLPGKQKLQTLLRAYDRRNSST